MQSYIYFKTVEREMTQLYPVHFLIGVSVFNNVSMILLPVLLQLLHQLTERWSLLRQQPPRHGHQKFISTEKQSYYSIYLLIQSVS